MSREIDERVVQMEFQNDRFEHNVSQTIGTLDKLQTALQFKGSDKSFGDIEAASNKVHFNGITGAIASLSSKFEEMGAAGTRIIQNLVDKAMGLGYKLVAPIKNMTIDQIGPGFDKYTTKTEAVQTIMNATGLEIDAVNKQLEKLNWFTDETSYDFAAMVTEIGKFTSNNIDLDTAVTSMQGIATWAAVSGQNATTASRAMYNFSQAIGAGSMMTKDWVSIENANMATAEFKQQAIEAAVATGALKRGMDGIARTSKGTKVTVESFRDSLSEKWFDKDTMIKTLKAYGGYADKLYELHQKTGLSAREAMEELGDAGMQLGQRAFKAAQEAKTFKDVMDATRDAVSSGWMNTFELIFGNYEKAKALWSTIVDDFYDLFAAGAETRNELFAAWNLMGGQQDLADGLHAFLQNVIAVKDWFSEKMWEFVPQEEVVDFLYNLTSGFKAFNERLFENTKFWDIVSYIAEAFGNVLEFVVRGVDRASKVFSVLASPLKQLEPLFTAIARFIRYVAIGLNESSKKGSFFEERLNRLKRLMAPLNEAFGKFIYNISMFIRKLGKSIESSEGLKKVINFLRDGFFNVVAFLISSGTKVLEFINGLFDGTVKLNPTLEKIVNFLKDIAKKIGDIIVNGKPLDLIGKAFEKIHGATTKLRKKIKELDIVEKISNAFARLKEIASNAFGSVKESFKKVGSGLKDFFSGMKDGLSITDAFGKAFNIDIDKSKLIEGVETLGGGAIFAILGKKISDFIKTTAGIDSWGQGLIKGLQKIGTAIAKFVKDPKSILGSFGELFDGIKKLFGGGGEEEENKFEEIADNLKKMAIGIAIIAGSLFFLSLLNPERLASSVVLLLALVGILLSMLKKLSKSMNEKQIAKFELIGAGLKVMASAIGTLSWAMKRIGKMSVEDILKAVIVIPLMLKVFDSFSKKMKPKKLAEAADGVKLMAKALKKLVKPLFLFNFIKIEAIAKAVISLLLLGKVMQRLSKSIKPKKMSELTEAFKDIGKALLILTPALLLFNFVRPSSLFKAAVVIALIGTVFAKLSKSVKPKSIIEISKAFMLFGVSLLIMAPALLLFNFVRPSSLLKAGVAIAGFCALMKKYGKRKITDNMLKLAGAMAVFGLALLACIPALFLFSFVPAAGIIKSALAVFFLFEIFKKVGNKKLGSLFKLIGALALVGLTLNLLVVPLMLFAAVPWPALGKAAVALVGVFAILGLATLILKPLAPYLITVAGALALVGAGLLMISMAVATFNIASFFGSLAKVTEQFHEALKGVARHLKSGTILAMFKNLLQMFVEWIKVIPQVAIVLAQGVLNFIATLGNGAAKVVIAAVKIGMAILTGLELIIPKVIKVGIKILLAMLQGIYQTLDQIVPLVFAILFKIIEALNTFLPTLIDVLFKLVISVINGVANAIRENSDAIWAAVGNLLSSIIELVLAMVQRLVGMIPGVGKKWSEAVGDARDKVREFLAPESLEADGEKASGGLLDGLTKGLSGAESVGEGASGGLLSGLFRGLSGEGEEAGAGVGADFLAGLGTTDAKGEGNAFSMDFVQGMLDTEDDAEGAGEKDGKAGVRGVGSQLSNFFNVGGDSATGFANGMTSNSSLQKIATAGAQMGKTAKDALKIEIDSNSPSKEFAKIGGDSADGYAIGTENKFNKVEKTYKTMGRLALDSALGMANEIDDILNDTSNQPVITPVVDMNMVREAAGEIGKTFGKTSIGVQNARAVAGLTSKRGYSTQYNGNNVVEAIDGLRVDVGKLEKVMGNMQVRMDTGALVGSMVGPMDNALGARMLRRRRG